MIKESKLIGTKLSMPYGWHEFAPLDLFDVHRGVRITTSHREPGSIPLVTAGNEHAGISDYINNSEQKLFNKSGIAITIDMFGNCFTRNYSFKADDNIIVLTNLEFSEQTMLFLGSVLQKLTYAQFNYGAQFRLNSLKSLKMSLPVTQDGQPDYGWMSSYIRELENQHILEMENQRIRELDTYLQVTGLDNTTLTDNELQVLEQWRQHEKFGGGTLLTKHFLVAQLFDVLLSAGDNKISDLPKGYIPLITSGASNNGIAGLVAFGDGDAQLFDEGVLTADMFGNVLFQPKAFYAVSHGRVNILKPVDDGATMLPLLFIASLIKKQTIGRYGFDYMLSSTRLHDLSIELPVTVDGTPDYDFMQTFIRAQEKLVMQNLAEFRQRQIDTTRQII